MKKGKSVKLNLFSPIKTSYGTVDSKDFKSIFINIQSWVTPKKELEGWIRVVNCLKRDIKLTVYDTINERVFKKDNIVDLDLRTSGICLGKKSFFNLEITLFVQKDVDFKNRDVKESIKKIIKGVYINNLFNNDLFEFYYSKVEFDKNE